MAVPLVAKGRGAFTTVGKDNGSIYYKAIEGKPWDGSFPNKDVNYQAVSLGVKAIQRRGNQISGNYGRNPVQVDGNYSPIDREMIKFVQSKLGIGVDGVVGPQTSKAMFRDSVAFWAGANNVPAEHVWGMTMLESAFDPGAVGYITPTDRGLCQINLVAHPTITVEQAFDHDFALNYTSDRLEKARAQFSGKGPALQRDCSIAQHNSPLAAKIWFEIGWMGEDEQIYKYVQAVLKHAATYK